jgi:hypothetical protein
MSSQPVQYFHTPPQEVRAERKADDNFNKLNDQFSSAHFIVP